MSSTIENEISKFTNEASKWWDVNGPFKLLHEINPIRLEYLLEQIRFHYNLLDNKKIKGIKILDVGCGGGVLSIPLARLGANVTAIDLGKENIEAAQDKAFKEKLHIDFVCTEVEQFALKHMEEFDIVLCFEVLEHVQDPELFISNLAKLVKKRGLVILSTINRNLKSRFLAIGMAEYVLRMLPKHTHNYNKFIKPSEINRYGAITGLSVVNFKGMTYDILRRDWALSNNIDVNYFATLLKV